MRGLKGYRAMQVKELHITAESITLGFHDSHISIQIRKSRLEAFGIESVTVGDTLFVKGWDGNRDVDLLGIDWIEDMREVR